MNRSPERFNFSLTQLECMFLTALRSKQVPHMQVKKNLKWNTFSYFIVSAVMVVDARIHGTLSLTKYHQNYDT